MYTRGIFDKYGNKVYDAIEIPKVLYVDGRAEQNGGGAWLRRRINLRYGFARRVRIIILSKREHYTRILVHAFFTSYTLYAKVNLDALILRYYSLNNTAPEPRPSG